MKTLVERLEAAHKEHTEAADAAASAAEYRTALGEFTKASAKEDEARTLTREVSLLGDLILIVGRAKPHA